MKVGQRPSPVEVGREPFINQRQWRRRRRQQLESLYGLLSVDYMRRAVPGSVFLGGHGSAYGRHALLHPHLLHRGVVQRRTSPGRSEDVDARDLRRGSRGQTPTTTTRPGAVGSEVASGQREGLNHSL